MAPKYKLTYFNLPVLGESIRLLLAYQNHEFEDVRIPPEKEKWLEVKHTTPFGKLPVLEIDGKTLHQTCAISRYLAKQCGLAGADDWESMQIDIAVDTINDIRMELTKYYSDYYFPTPNEELKAQTYGPVIKEALPYYMEKFDDIVKNNGGYFVNGKLSWADTFFVAVIDYMSAIAEYNIPDKYPHLKSLKEKVVSVPQIAAYIAKRPTPLTVPR